MFYTLIIGVVSGVVASLLTILITLWIRPKIVVSPQISKSKKNSLYIYKVKFLNNSHCDIFNITYKLCYLKQDKDKDISSLDLIQPRNKTLFIHLKKKCNKNTDNAIRIGYDDIDENIMKNDNIKLLFQVTAKHSIFNTMKQFQQIYSYTDIVEGEFCVGNSMKIV